MMCNCTARANDTIPPVERFEQSYQTLSCWGQSTGIIALQRVMCLKSSSASCWGSNVNPVARLQLLISIRHIMAEVTTTHTLRLPLRLALFSFPPALSGAPTRRAVGQQPCLGTRAALGLTMCETRSIPSRGPRSNVLSR